MAAVRGHKPGVLCWAELCTSDVEGAWGFYGELFGWSFDPFDAYWVATRQASAVAGLVELLPAQRAQRIAPNWIGHFAVKDADASAARAVEAGGRVLAPAFDRAGARRAWVADPSGAAVGLWEPHPRIGAELLSEPGALTWAELETPDPAGAVFYGALFGWKPQRLAVGARRYTVFNAGDIGTAGMVEREAATARWTPCFCVSDCDEASARASVLGGAIDSAPADVAGVGRFATLVDPQGARFSVMHPASG